MLIRGRRYCPLLLLVCVLLLGACSSANHLLDQEIPPVSYAPPTPDTWELPNGLRIFYVRDDELPTVRGTLFVRGGTVWQQPTELGQFSAMGSQMRQGGTIARDPDALDRELETLAASVGSSFGSEYGTVSFACLAADFGRVFKLFSDVVLHPRFDQQRLSLYQAQELEGIARRKEQPGTVINIGFLQLLYGDTPYGWVKLDKDVKALTRAKLRAAHRRLVVPQHSYLAISGAVDRSIVQQLVEKRFRDWKGKGMQLSPPPVDYTPKSGVYFIKSPFPQARISFGHLSVPRHTADHYAIRGFNTIFGEAADSRLFKRIRTELGLAYGVYGGIDPGLVRGTSSVAFPTRAEVTGQALVEALRVLQDTRRQPVQRVELESMKRSVANSYVFKFDSKHGLVRRAVLLKLLGYPDDYDETFLDRVSALKPEDVLEVARKRWRPDEFVVLVVGNEVAYDSVRSVMQDPPDVLRGYELTLRSFDQALL